MNEVPRRNNGILMLTYIFKDVIPIIRQNYLIISLLSDIFFHADPYKNIVYN